MFQLKKGDIFTFGILPDWANYEAIYFVVNEIEEDKSEVKKGFTDKNLDVSVIVEFDNHMVKGDNTGMSLTSNDIETFHPSIITDDAKLAKILLVE